MEKEFVPYELAVKLKELGFDEPCFGYYWENLLHFQTTHTHPATMPNSPENCLAPTFSQCFSWFREKGYDVKVVKESPGLYFGFYWNGAAWIMVDNGTYEASEQACLDKLIQVMIIESK